MTSRHKSNFSRREFLSLLALQSVAAAVYPTSALAINSLVKVTAKPTLAFVDRQGLGPDLDAPDVESLCCALHTEKILPASASTKKERQGLEAAMKQLFQQEGLPWKDYYQVGLTAQHYGVADETAHADELLKYCNDVQDFVYAHLSDLLDVNVKWRPLEDHADYASIAHGQFQGFVGRYTYYVMRAVVLNAEDGDDLPYLVRAWPMERAIHYIVEDQQLVPDGGTLYIIPGATSLVAPFSELLHLTFHQPSQRYAQTLSQSVSQDQALQVARVAGETVNEAAAIVLASKYLQKLGRSDRIATVNYMTNSLSESYPLLPKAITFMQQQGVQKAVDLYHHDPGKFLSQIKIL
ncbi:hypothetical protein [Kaarinaea lacus]